MADSSSDTAQPGGLGYRLVVSLVFLALTALAVVVFFVSLGALEPAEIAGEWAFGSQLLLLFEQQTWEARALVVLGSAVAGLLCCAVVWHQWSFGRSDTSPLHLLDADDRGFVVVDSRGVAVVAEQAALTAHGVLGADVRIRGSGRAPVRVRVRIELYPGANVKRAGTEVRNAVAKSLDELVGLEVRDITVSAHVAETDAMTRVLA